MIGYLSK